MAGSDAIVVVEDWISEHYFTSDAKNESFQAEVLKRRKVWDSAEDGIETPRSRFGAIRGTLGSQLAELLSEDEDTARTAAAEVVALCDSLRAALGYNRHEYAVHARQGVHRYNTPGVTADAPLVVVDAVPVATHEELFDKGATTLLQPYVVDDALQFTSMPRLVSHLFLAEDAPEFALVLAGRWALIGERSRWAEGRYLAVNLQTVCERNDTKRGGEIDRALTCLAAESLAPDPDGAVWWSGVLQDSVEHTVGVSKDLREGVRLSIEIIANEVVSRRALQGRPPLPQAEAQPLAKQSLRFLYRILFLLYAEASPEMAVLPVDAPEYEAGYSLSRLRELTLVEIADPRSQQGTHLYESLGLLFRLVDRGHRSPTITDREGGESTDGLDFQPLRADLFQPEATALIDDVKLGNAALQRVLRHLLLSKQSTGRDRGFISYVELGINQLGAVYEGLMSYTGSFAETDLYEVARNGDSSKGSWVVPIERADGIAESDFVRVKDEITGELVPVRHDRGTFVFRLSGRERQQSASYYTPEVLTRFTVGQALAELLDQNGRTTTSEEILALTICEPALGSGAFAIEAVRQLAAEYLTRRQAELGNSIPPEDYPLELQRVKASIALHQVYGVDLNATAVEFAEIALWLDTMAAGLQAPWFGLHLRRGNSLIGARRAVYTRDQVNTKHWLTTAPTDVPLTDLAQRVADDDPHQTDAAGRIPHWLLPAKGWGSTADSKEAKQLAPERTKPVASWRRSVIGIPTKTQLDALVELGHQAEELWRMAYRRLHVAEQQSRRPIPLWGHDAAEASSVVTREQIEDSLADPDGAYRRLRRVMDAWCALWFWPLTGDDVAPPTLAEWIDACQQLLGRDRKARRAAAFGAATLAPDDVWQALADQEDLAIKGAGAQPITDVVAAHPWLTVCEQVAEEQGFFHWQLDFATVFGRGGFDLQVGNPPWVRPDTDVDALLAEGDPWWELAENASEAQRLARRPLTLRVSGMADALVAGDSDVVAARASLGSVINYPNLAGLRPDLYRCFMAATWRSSSPRGITALVHPETHFTDEKAGSLRADTYHRLRRHWQFGNDLKLFQEIDNHVTYGVHTYGAPKVVDFLHACYLYHPEMVERSLSHDGSGPIPGLKNEGHWDMRPHRLRIQRITDYELELWRDALETQQILAPQTRMLYVVSSDANLTIRRVLKASRLSTFGLRFSAGWNETNDRKAGNFVRTWTSPSSWDLVVLQGPHIFVANPLNKLPNKTLRSNKDWSNIDLEQLEPLTVPDSSYQFVRAPALTPKPASLDRALGEFRLAWRSMAANSGERTLISAIIPPGPGNFQQNLYTAYLDRANAYNLALVAGYTASLLADFLVRSAPKSSVRLSTIERLPHKQQHPLLQRLAFMSLRLNCLTAAYAPLWEEAWLRDWRSETWALDGIFSRLTPLGVERTWTPQTPLRKDLDRRMALVEIDAMVALILDIPARELCTIYRGQFGVLNDYDRDVYYYDGNGRLVPHVVLTAWRKKGDAITEADRSHTNSSGNTYVYELPFRTYDREDDMRAAYAEFERRLRERYE